MKVLVADDNPAFRLTLQTVLTEWGYEVALADDGLAAWQLLHEDRPPSVAILDWMMPGMSGLEICEKIREQPLVNPPYLILLTGRVDKEDIIAGLEGGADDYILKPVDFAELRARINAGRRISMLQQHLTQRVAELEDALGHVQQLQGLLPICSYCKKIRDDKNYWLRVETYISRLANIQFSHGICPDCLERVVKPEIARMQAARKGN